MLVKHPLLLLAVRVMLRENGLNFILLEGCEGKDAGPAPFCSENGTFLMPPSVTGKVAQDFMANVEGLRDESLLGVYPKHLVLFYFLTLPLIEGFFFCFQKSLNCVV